MHILSSNTVVLGILAITNERNRNIFVFYHLNERKMSVGKARCGYTEGWQSFHFVEFKGQVQAFFP